MAELAYAILAEYARIEPATGLLTLVGGSFDRVFAPSLPALHQAVLAIRVLLDEDQAGVDLTVSIETPDRQHLIRVNGRAENPADAVPVDGMIGLSSVVPLPLTLPVVGLYQVHVSLDGREASRLAFLVTTADDTPDTAM